MVCKNDGRSAEYAQMLYAKNQPILEGNREFLKKKGAL
jgi:hypothetical protein